MTKIELIYVPEQETVTSRVDKALTAIIEVLEYQGDDYQAALAIAVNCLRNLKRAEIEAENY